MQIMYVHTATVNVTICRLLLAIGQQFSSRNTNANIPQTQPTVAIAMFIALLRLTEMQLVMSGHIVHDLLDMLI